MEMFKLSTILSGHHDDVRGVSSTNDDCIVTVSRDKTAGIWERHGSVNFSMEKMLIAHSSYVNSVTILKVAGNYYVVTGGSDKIIYVWDILDCSNPIFTLIGHTDNVCTLSSSSDGKIFSGSWDKTAKIWNNYQCEYTLVGHEYAIWDIIEFNNNSVLTASADKTIRRWINGVSVNTYTGHQDCVRALVDLNNGSFASAGNDSCIRIWSEEGSCLMELFGHSSFIYSLDLLPTGELVSSSEDRTVKLWKDVQTIILPATSIWCVSTISNGDIVCGTSNNSAYVFTRDKERYADSDTLKIFNEANANFAESKKTKEKINSDKLPGVERLLQPGTKDQQVIMVKNGSEVEAHQWDSSTNNWLKVGVVTDAVGQERKQLYEGKEYDYVFSVDLEDGKPVKKLPYNCTENPYTAAQNFINKYELSGTYLDEIANFIVRNAEGVEIGSNQTGGDPLTGGSRYVANGSDTTSMGSLSNYKDPFTGGSRYISSNSQSAARITQSSAKEFTCPKKYVNMESGNPSAIYKKLEEFNSKVKIQNSDKSFDQDEMSIIKAVLNKISGEESSGEDVIFQGIDKVVSRVMSWPIEYRFPLLDIIRLAASKIHFNGEIRKHLLAGDSLEVFIEKSSNIVSDYENNNLDGIQARAIMAMRMSVNMFSCADGQIEIALSGQELLKICKLILSSSPNKNLKLAVSSFLMNLAYLLYNKIELSKDTSFFERLNVNQIELMSNLVELSSEFLNSESQLSFVEINAANTAQIDNTDVLLRLVNVVGILGKIISKHSHNDSFAVPLKSIKNSNLSITLNAIKMASESDLLTNTIGEFYITLYFFFIFYIFSLLIFFDFNFIP
ncbi:Phospholipase A-2-activating protein [Smittium culicis]|uniref:Phospholipase A-2-activating protein n=1 Tax=Smittium culicis TaxID=133412 RepID=A0A1R1XM72_9FUNG|nr:Phospholipase A-2-activating protein [Smittium culicis]